MEGRAGAGLMLYLRLPLCILFSLSVLPGSRSQAFPPNTTGYTCDAAAGAAAYPCRTYVLYHATSPNFLDLASIGDLFEVSRLMIASPNNISAPAARLAPGQPLLVPVSCSCNAVPSNNTQANANNFTGGHLSYAPINYTRKSTDTYYLVSTYSFLNLTTYQSVEIVNPTLVPTNLSIGVNIVFPVFCRCPNRTRSTNNRPNFLISYVFQPSDSLSSVASFFGTSTQSITNVNGNRIQLFDTIFVPVSRLPVFSQSNASAPPSPPPTPPPAVGAPRRVERKGVIMGLAIGLGICGILLFLVAGLWAYREDAIRKGRKIEGEDEGKEADTAAAARGGYYKELKAEGMNVSECLDKYRVYEIAELRDATGGFDERCLINGSVYKGHINEEVYAIKKMKWNAYEELKILQKVNHGNLVKLEGFCIDPEDATCYLVYEYVENGSLHSWLHGSGDDHSRHQKLSWKTRLGIAIDVANGLQYIHEHTRPRVVHKDIKTSNVLLDANMRAKIANFGLARSGCNAITMHIVGTQGYIAPEYLADGVVSTKMDVFSFGVVLLELVSGRDAVDERGEALWAAAARDFGGSEEERACGVRDWMDGALADEAGATESVSRVVGIAMACLHRNPAKRPGMVDIVYGLCKSDEDSGVFDVSNGGTGSAVMAR